MLLEPRQITPRVHQGGWIRPDDIAVLRDIGITHILNLDLPYDDPLPFMDAGFELKTVPVMDNCLMLPQQVRDILAVIDGWLSSSPRHKVYVHCVEGVSRSATICWLYLIRSGLPPEQAAERIHPNRLMFNQTLLNILAAEAN